MSALAKIKKTAAQYEQDRHYDKALAQYARLLDGEAGGDEEVDVTLYNRAGDLALRAGDVPRAVTYFERAIDLYAAGGFLNNAVALAVKIRRHAPGHLAAHHTLGVLYARKGFRAEARQHLAEYAAHMHRAGRADEVRRTLTELACLGTSADELAAARDLLATHAATADDAGALVTDFDATLAPAARVESALGHAAAVPVVPLSELIELEVRGGSRAASDTGERPPRWATALPGDSAPLRLAVLRTLETARETDGGGRAAPDASHTAAPDTGFELLDLSLPEPPHEDVPRSGHDAALEDPDAVSAFDVAPLDLAPLDLAPLDLAALDVGPHDAPAFATADAGLPAHERSAVGAPTTAPTTASIDWDAAGSRQIEQLHNELARALPTLDEVAAPDVPRPHALAAPESPGGAPPEPRGVTDLGEWLRSTELPRSTRLVTPAPRESGDEAADFDAALQTFTTGIAQSVDAGDRESHYDLGVAFREMGLFANAVRELQRALAAPGGGLREREALAHCFLDLGRPELTLATLEQAAADALASGAPGQMLVGVQYVLAEAARAVGRADDARTWYVRVLATDYGFRDAAAHLAALPRPRTTAAS